MKPITAAIAFIAPLAIFFAIDAAVPYRNWQHETGQYETSAAVRTDQPADAIDPARYRTMVIARVIAMAMAIGILWRFYLRSFPFRIDYWAPLVGIIGGVGWISCCWLGLESKLMHLVGFPLELLGARNGVDPIELYAESGQLTLFLIARFALLVVTVPIAEELFLRGFLMRFVDATEWYKLGLSEIGAAGIVSGTVYGMLTHPSEFVAAAIWFSLITWMMLKTGKFWNCVVAHALTNLILGIYIITAGSWHLW